MSASVMVTEDLKLRYTLLHYTLFSFNSSFIEKVKQNVNLFILWGQVGYFIYNIHVGVLKGIL